MSEDGGLSRESLREHISEWLQETLVTFDEADDTTEAYKYLQGQVEIIELASDLITPDGPEDSGTSLSAAELSDYLQEKLDELVDEFDYDDLDSDDYSYNQGKQETLEIILGAISAGTF